MSKFSMLVAGTAGYVLGARAGRQRYDQIVDQAQRLWSNPKVQQASRSAQDLAREKAPVVGSVLGSKSSTSTSSPTSSMGTAGVTTDLSDPSDPLATSPAPVSDLTDPTDPLAPSTPSTY